jgi:PIN domain nuclease of toxin-antitoxin system
LRLLLDTHIWLHSVLDPRLLSRPVLRALSRASAEFWLSPISGLELVSLSNKRRFRTIGDPIAWMTTSVANAGIREAPLTMEIAYECARFALPHGDPADRIIVATARVLDLILVTEDRKIIESRLVETVPND